MRVYHPFRNMFDVFDECDLTADERENSGNVERFKAHVKKLVDARREEMKDPSFSKEGSFDFLTQLLSDELYLENDKMIMDECLTFIGAATQTTTFLMSNIIYYLMKNPKCMAKVQQEVREKLLTKLP